MPNYCSVLIIFVIDFVICQRRPLVRINQGLIEGSSIYTDSSKICHSYIGVPYAAPPIGDLRFLPPQRHDGWNGTFQATNYGRKCPQLPFKLGETDSEDCLFLNIWTPGNQGSYSPLLPVIVFFEGSQFARSSDLPLSGQDLATEGMIVVSVNYRLNVFGFFCLGTPEARGNLGLLDQYFAILWIRDNIKQFGGDSEKLTLFGYDSGAVSVTLHLMSPRTAGIFQRAIISSGSALTPWQTSNDPTVASKEILRLLGCSSYITNALQCMRSKKVEHILQAFQEYSESYNWTDMLLPVVDTFLPENNQYLPIEPNKALKEGTYLQVPILTGITKPIANPQYGEWLDLASQGFFQLQQYTERAKIPEIMRLYRFNGLVKDQILELIKWRYSSFNDADSRLLYEQLKNLEFEAKLEAPHFMQLSNLISTYVQPIYVYYIDDIGIMLNTTDSLASTDLLLLFGPVLLKQAGRRRFNSNEQRLSTILKHMWLNFVTFGNPTPNNNRNKVWRKYTTEDPYIEHFDTVTDTNEKVKKRIQRINFWNSLLPKIYSLRGSMSSNIPRELQNSPDPAAGFRHAMYTLMGLVIALLILLTICVVLLKKRSKDRERHLHMVY